MDIAVKDGRIVGVRGLATDRINHGRLDPKDLYGWQANNSPDRLTHPLVRDEHGELVRATWDEAMGRIVARSKELLDRPGGWGRHGFYTSGQLFLEEYYTLGIIGKAGIGTPHMDGNTRLCTATAGAAMKESFGVDAQPGSYTDIDHCDAIALWGHNVAETQAVLWMRMLDRRRGPNPPRMLCVDPRSTAVAREADVHLAIKGGTNVACLNGLLRELIARDRHDADYVAAHTVGFDELRATVEPYTLDRVAEICAVPREDLEAAAELLGTCDRLFSTVLQGFYQSNQATAAACQVNNVHLIRGMIGRPGAGLCQMNGQPTAQNTRESGANGDLPAMRNWDNPDHVAELAELWRVEPDKIPHWAAPTHALQIWRYVEEGSIDLFWIQATNPAVSMPELPRIREILQREGLFLVVQDLFLTETAQYADVVLPAATWGEKLGAFTCVDRTVHLSEKAVDPPGEARADLDIFLDYARRMDFRDKHGDPLLAYDDAEGAFEAWKACTKGRPNEYVGMTYDRLRESSLQWPCNDEHPDGKERLYDDGVFATDPDFCETYGQDLQTGATVTADDYRAHDPGRRAFLRPAPYTPSAQVTTPERPLLLTTGRTVYQFHTRTKTGRAPQLQAAAPEAWLEVNVHDAEELGLREGDRARVEGQNGLLEAAVRISGIRRGMVFVPFHYGYWDTDHPEGPGQHPGRAANEMTVTGWDPVSKQPPFKVTAVSVVKVADGDGPSPAPSVGGSAAADPGSVPVTVGGPDAEAASTEED
jgi:anaerobic selenocysteine-containing dehydrogenase